jgi:predicted RNase H-like nuclease (RuvC/YqgF family)
MMQKISVGVLLLLGMFAGSVGAETYTWVDSSGTTNFTEDISQVPKKYLKKVRVRGDVTPAVSGGTESTAEAVSPAPAGTKAPTGSSEKKEVMFGSKTGKSWKADFDTLRAQIGATDDQISELNTRLGDTSKMSRSDYLSIQSSMRNLQFHRGELEKKLKTLNEQASQASVPGEFR